MGNPGKSDEELMDEVKAGSMESYNVLYDRYKRAILNYAYQILRHSETAQDCAQEVFVLVHERAHQYKAPAKFSAWLYRIARNQAFDFLRKRKIRRVVSLDASPKTGEPAQALEAYLKSPEPTPGEAAESEELRMLVQDGIARLSAKDRELVVLFHIQGLSQEEIGGIMGYSAQTVNTKLYRARRRLAKLIGVDPDLFKERLS